MDDINTEPAIERSIVRSVKRTCPYCHSEYEIKPGLKNAKNLFRKPTWDEWFILVLLIMVMIGAYFYYNDTKTCREFLSSMNQSKIDLNPMNRGDINGIINNYSGRLAEAENKINSIPLIPSNENQ